MITLVSQKAQGLSCPLYFNIIIHEISCVWTTANTIQTPHTNRFAVADKLNYGISSDMMQSNRGAPVTEEGLFKARTCGVTWLASLRNHIKKNNQDARIQEIIG